jgi:hypothetical protein
MESFYEKFCESEQHFNSIQANIRNIASGWMLAAFTAIAALLRSSSDGDWLAPPVVLLATVSFMASLGLLVLWISDQLVYQRLLNAVFLIALKWEHDDKRLPPIRAMMMLAAEGKGMSRWMTLFYTIPMWAFLAISAVSAAVLRDGLGQRIAGTFTYSDLAIAALFAAQGTVTLWVQLKKDRVENEDRATMFGDERFAALFSEDERGRQLFADIVRRHTPPQSEMPSESVETTHAADD